MPLLFFFSFSFSFPLILLSLSLMLYFSSFPICLTSAVRERTNLIITISPARTSWENPPSASSYFIFLYHFYSFTEGLSRVLAGKVPFSLSFFFSRFSRSTRFSSTRWSTSLWKEHLDGIKISSFCSYDANMFSNDAKFMNTLWKHFLCRLMSLATNYTLQKFQFNFNSRPIVRTKLIIMNAVWRSIMEIPSFSFLLCWGNSRRCPL